MPFARICCLYWFSLPHRRITSVLCAAYFLTNTSQTWGANHIILTFETNHAYCNPKKSVTRLSELESDRFRHFPQVEIQNIVTKTQFASTDEQAASLDEQESVHLKKEAPKITTFSSSARLSFGSPCRKPTNRNIFLVLFQENHGGTSPVHVSVLQECGTQRREGRQLFDGS